MAVQNNQPIQQENQNSDNNNEVKYITMTNPITQQQIQVPENLRDFVSDIVRFNKKIGREPYENENNELKNQVSQLQAEFDKINTTTKQNKNQEIEGIKTQLQGVIEELNKKNQALENQKTEIENKFSHQKLYNDVQNALNKYDVHNREQLAEIFMQKAKLKDEINIATGEKTGNQTGIMLMDIKDESGIRTQEFNINEGVKRFFENEANQFHLKNRLQPGSGSQSNQNTNGASSKMKRNDFEALLPQQKVDAMKAGVQLID